MNKKKKSTFKYQCPTELGYNRIKVSKKVFNKHFPNRKVNAFVNFEIYFSDENKRVKISYFTNIFGKLITTALYPVQLLMEGLSSFSNINRSIYLMWNQKKTGSFTSDTIYGVKKFSPLNTAKYYYESLVNLGIKTQEEADQELNDLIESNKPKPEDFFVKFASSSDSGYLWVIEDKLTEVKV